MIESLLNNIVLKIACVICAVTLLLPCCSATVDGQKYITTMITSIWGYLLLVFLALTFAVSCLSFRGLTKGMGLTTGAFGLLAIYMRYADFSSKLLDRGMPAGGASFTYGYYIAFPILIAMIIYSLPGLLSGIVRKDR